jgi:HSP20 family protein
MWPENWSPFFDVEKTLNEMDRIFNVVGRPLNLRSVPRGTFPAVNVYDRGNQTVLVAEMPGVRSEDVELTVVGDSITLQGRREEQPNENEQFYRRERPMGAFARTVTLPAAVNPEKVKAEYHDGVLRVSMEKAEQAKSRKVEIKS